MAQITTKITPIQLFSPLPPPPKSRSKEIATIPNRLKITAISLIKIFLVCILYSPFKKYNRNFDKLKK